MSGFADLRLNAHGTANEEGFWPSFTDIMTVIVIIFLLAIVGILLRNFELVRELQTTMQAEREAAAIARSTAEEKAAIASRLDESESELSRLRLQVMQLRDTNQTNFVARRAAETELTALRERNQTLQQQQATLTEELAASRSRLVSIESDLAAARDKNVKIKTERDEAALQLMAARGEYTELKAKYDKLVKPARSARGKQVVEVRYRKLAGKGVIDARLPGAAGFVRMERVDLDRSLEAIKAKNPGELYVKIIIPENSGLSYNEAWGFTSEMLKRYDYYYQ